MSEEAKMFPSLPCSTESILIGRKYLSIISRQNDSSSGSKKAGSNLLILLHFTQILRKTCGMAPLPSNPSNPFDAFLVNCFGQYSLLFGLLRQLCCVALSRWSSSLNSPASAQFDEVPHQIVGLEPVPSCAHSTRHDRSCRNQLRLRLQNLFISSSFLDLLPSSA